MREKLKLIRVVAFLLLGGLMESAAFAAIAGGNELSPLSTEESRLYSEVAQLVKQQVVDPVSDKKLFNMCIGGMVAGADPESAYLDTETFTDIESQAFGGVAGVGLELDTAGGYPLVIAPIEDGPADAAGIRSGDTIIKIDDRPAKGLLPNDAVKLLRGKPGTSVKLTVKRKGESRPIVVTVARQVLKPHTVKSKLLESGFAYIRITHFQAETGDSLASTIKSLYRQSGQNLKGLILDLRNNPGGLLISAVAVSAVFLPQNSRVLYTEGRTVENSHRYDARPEDYLWGTNKSDNFRTLPSSAKTVPLVVLVNNGSAAASEIVAGALQDHKRATIVGMPTFGRASIQTILPLANRSAIKLTTARWFTPNGRSARPDGILPDVVIESGETSSGPDIQLEQALTILKNSKQSS